MRQTAGGHPRHRVRGLSTAQSTKKEQKAPDAQRAPQAEEEDPRVKCRDCGAFGHTARSRRCPMKCWAGALAPQPLGSSTKENLEPKKPWNAHNAAPFNKAEREKEQRQRQGEEKRKALLQKYPKMLPGRQQKGWKEVTESCDYVRHPSRPMPVYTTKSKSASDSSLPSQPPVKESDMTFMRLSGSPVQRPRLSSFSSFVANEGPAVTSSESPEPALSHFGQAVPVVKLADNGPDGGSLGGPQAASKTLGLGHTFHPQAGAKRPGVNTQASPQPAPQRLSQDSNLRTKAAGKRPAVSSMQGCQNLPKKPRLDSFQTSRKTTETPELEAVHILPPPSNPTGRRQAASPRVTKDTLSPLPSSDLRPRQDRPRPNADRACTVSHHPPPSHAPGQPLRVLFRRLDNGWWSSRLMTSPSPCLPERSTPPAQSSHVLEKSEGHCSRVPLSVLYEDLQLSSSSEESDWD